MVTFEAESYYYDEWIGRSNNVHLTSMKLN